MRAGGPATGDIGNSPLGVVAVPVCSFAWYQWFPETLHGVDSVSETLLRYWEKEFPQQITPKKGSRGVRRYTKEDIEKIRTIYDLVKVRGLKLAAAREVLKQNKQGTAQPLEAIQRLRKVKEELVAMKRALESM